MDSSQTSPDALADASPSIDPSQKRRVELDRRAQPTGIFDSFRGWSRRAFSRRAGESKNYYVDLYQPRDLALLIGILSLNVLDAFFTLRWLEMGGRETNPLMDWLLSFGDWAFLVQKCIVVGIWLIVLTVHKNFRIARIGLWSLLVLYTMVLFYHFFLQAGPAPTPI